MIVRYHLRHAAKYFIRPLSHGLISPVVSLSNIQLRKFCSDTEDDPEDKNYHSLISKFLPSVQGHNLLVLQPYVKWGWQKRRDTTAELQLEEAVALVSTLRRWNVVDQQLVPLENLEKHAVFGTGKLEELQVRVRKNKKISAIFISTKIMTTEQKADLEKLFRLPIYDRYSIVIQIFKENAVTKHAKLQVALAELPYIRNLLSSESHRAASLGMSHEAIRLTLHSREAKLRAEMKKCQIYHHTLEKNRLQRKIPLVAVVGYTNAGKTSIIKALTGEKKLEPKNSLFATLDVTMHEGYLPSRLKVVFVDTVGFMSDLPDTLLDCFVATLEHVAYADAIVHVCDGSHPDLAQQREHTMKTLSSFKNVAPGFLDRVITVRNKCDKCPAGSDFQDDLPVSAKSGRGMAFLQQIIEAIIVKTTNRQMMVLRVPSGGEEAKWLYKETAVCEVEADLDDGQFLRFKVLLSDVQLAKFKSYFLKGRQTG